MFFNTVLPKEFWDEAINSACYFVNGFLSIFIHFTTPKEV